MVFPALGILATNRPIQSFVEWVLGAFHATVMVPPDTTDALDGVTAYPEV